MKLKLMFLCAAMTSLGFAAENPVLKDFASNMIFYHSFETKDADLAEGDAKSKKYGQVTPSHKDGGLIGKCLYDGRYSFQSAGNIDMSTPGTLIVWVCHRNFPTEQGNCKNNPAWWVFQMLCNKIHVQFGMPGHFPWGKGSLLAIAYSSLKDWKKSEVYLWGTGSTPTKWKNNEWHMLAMSWSPTGISFSADGSPWKSSPIVRPLTHSNVTFTIGGRQANKGLVFSIDELMIFSKALDNAAIKKIYDSVKAAANKK